MLWEKWQNRPPDRYFQEKILHEPKFLHLPILRKALKPLTKISVPLD